MKDLVQIWNRVSNRRYSNVNTSDRELKEIANNRLKKSDIDAFDSNFAECEVLNNKFSEDIDFNQRKDAIINRLFERRRQGQIGRQPKCLFILLMLGFFSLTAGFFVLFAHPYAFLFKQKVVLQDGGEIFEMWRKPEVELYCRVYLFNVTNAEEYMAGKDDKLKVQEIGPYVYRERLEHEVTSFNENGTLSAIPRHPLEWMEDMSEGHHENDTVFMPHIALLSIANVVAKKNMFIPRFGLNNLISVTNSQPLIQMTAREFMMGHKSELMRLGNTFMPGWIYFDKLGLIDRMYDFTGDYETIFTGEQDVRQSGLIDTYRGSTDLPQWNGKHCSNVQYASDGTKFMGGVNFSDSQLFYRKSLCRAAPLIPTEEGVRSGLKAYKYTFPDHMLDNGKYLEENKCFCRNGECLPDGLIDVTECYYGFPIALSYPHFYQGDDILFNKIEGLSPNKELHETRFWVEPDSGLPLDVSSKFQINMALGDISMITNTKLFSNMYLPMLWFDIRMYELPPSMEQRFKLYLNILPVVEQAAMYALFISGTVLILSTVYILTFKVMFKSFDKDFEKWTDKKTKDIYSPCEVSVDSSDTDEDLKLGTEKRGSLLDDLKELSNKLTDKMYDTVGSVRDKVTDRHVRDVFTKRPSIMEEKIESCKSDSSSDEKELCYKNYKAVNQNDSDDDCRYLEVVDDGIDFEVPLKRDQSEQMKKLDKVDSVILHITD